jgi:hypothetical protein
MKRFGWVLLLFVAAMPAWAAKKITVGQLQDLLRSMQQDKKSDADVATALKQIELSEELTRSAMNSLVRYVPGPRSTEQIYVLEARSADLIPPPSDLPNTPPPDAAGQQGILAKAAAYVTGRYEKLPSLTATRTTLRFQDNVDAISSSSGIGGSAKDVVTNSGFSNPAAFVHYINATQAQVAIQHGAERLPAETTKIPWGANTMIALQEPDPNLGAIFRQAQEANSIKWLRWETVNGKQAAVYSFAVPKKDSRLALNVCCFPALKQAGIATFYTATTAATLGGGGGGGGGGVAGNFQTSTEWHNYKTTAPYHGEFFIDPVTGIVVRMIVEAELEPSEVVHQVDTRIDYGPTNVAGSVMVVPVQTIVNTEVVPNGDSGAGGYTTRCTLFSSQYKDYRPAGAK